MTDYWHLTNLDSVVSAAPLLSLNFVPSDCNAPAITENTYLLLTGGRIPAPKGWGISVSILQPGVLPDVYVCGNLIICRRTVGELLCERLPNSMQCLNLSGDLDGSWKDMVALYIYNAVEAIDRKSAQIYGGGEISCNEVFGRPIPLKSSKLPKSPACFCLIENGYVVADTPAMMLMKECGIPNSYFYSDWLII